MPLSMLCVSALPVMGVRWHDVAQAVKNAKLPMTAPSVARVLRRHMAKDVTKEDVADIVTKLKLHLAVSQSRVWHLIKLLEPTTEESPEDITVGLPNRIAKALNKNGKQKTHSDVQVLSLDDYVYLSVQLGSVTKQGSALYVAVPPGQHVAFVSTLSMRKRIQACVEGFGYQRYEDENLYGRDMKSLLRIYNRTCNESNADNLMGVPEYAPTPVLTKNGIDYTNKAYNEMYVNNILGPSPPLLTDLNIVVATPFVEQTIMRGLMKIEFELKSPNVAETLKAWVANGALAPTSDFFLIFQNMQSNKISYNPEEKQSDTEIS